MKIKDSAELTNEELDTIFDSNKKLTQDIKYLYISSITDAESQLENIRHILSDFTGRTSSVLTFAGLLALLPSLTQLSENYIYHFLIWTFPFLIFAILFFYFSSIRINSVFQSIPTYPPDTLEELKNLRDRTKAYNKIYRLAYTQYNKALNRYRVTNALIYVYIISFVTHFIYLFLKVYRTPSNPSTLHA